MQQYSNSWDCLVLFSAKYKPFKKQLSYKKIVKRNVLIGILFVFLSYDIYTQILNHVSFSGSKGSILEHTKKLSHLIEQRPYFFEIAFSKTADGHQLWHHENQFPNYGLLINYQNLGNPRRLGSALATSIFFELNLHKLQNFFNMKLRFAGGLAYLTKRFDLYENHKNIALSSHVNVFVALRWSFFIKMNSHLFLIPNLQFSHVSNGRYKVPNLGINTVYPNIGFQYQIQKTERKTVTDSSYQKNSKNEIYLWFGYGRNQEYPPGTKSFSNYTLSGTYFWNIKNRHQLGIGLDVYQEPSLNIRTQNVEWITNYYFKNGLSGGLKMAYAFNYGRWILPIEYGYYLFSGVNQFPNGMHFHRIGLRYYHKKHWVTSFTLKSHFAVAYHFDLGLGYRIMVRKK